MKSLIPNIYNKLLSRDYKEIKCSRTSCMYNRFDECTVPSRCEINEDGYCEGYCSDHNCGK